MTQHTRGGGLVSDPAVIDHHARVWDEHATSLRMVAAQTLRLRFRRTENAGMFTGVMATHDAVASHVYETCMEGAAIWDMISHFLRMTHALYVHADEEAMREFKRLHDMVATGAYNPMRDSGPNPFPLAK